MTFREVKAKQLLLNLKSPFLLRYSSDGTVRISRYSLLYLEIHSFINNERIELGPLEGDIFPCEII